MSEATPLWSFAGTFLRRPLGQPGHSSSAGPLSNEADADELALARLDDARRRARPARASYAGTGSPFTLTAALVDLAPPVARRLAEARLQNAPAGRPCRPPAANGRLGHLLRRLVPAHDLREMRLAGARALLPVPARRDPPRELELPLQRILRMLAAAGERAPTTAAAPCPGSTSSCRTSPRAAPRSRCSCRATSTSSRRRRARRAADT